MGEAGAALGRWREEMCLGRSSRVVLSGGVPGGVGGLAETAYRETARGSEGCSETPSSAMAFERSRVTRTGESSGAQLVKADPSLSSVSSDGRSSDGRVVVLPVSSHSSFGLSCRVAVHDFWHEIERRRRRGCRQDWMGSGIAAKVGLPESDAVMPGAVAGSRAALRALVSLSGEVPRFAEGVTAGGIASKDREWPSEILWDAGGSRLSDERATVRKLSPSLRFSRPPSITGMCGHIIGRGLMVGYVCVALGVISGWSRIGVSGGEAPPMDSIDMVNDVQDVGVAH